MDAVRFENENNINYMVIEEKGEQAALDFELKMLEKNKIQGLLPLYIRQINNRRLYYYEITAKQQMSKIFSFNKIKWQDLKMICEGIAMMVHTVNEYLLALENIILKPELIFMDLSKRQLYFTYYPGVNEDLAKHEKADEQLRQLFEYILEHYDHSTEKEELMTVYDMYQKIVQNEYNLEKLGEFVSEKPEKNNRPDGEDIQKPENEEKTGIKQDNEKNAGKVIDAIPCETVHEEKEVYDVKKINLQKGIKAIAGACILWGMLHLLLPDMMLLQVSSIAAIIFIAAGSAVFLVLERMPKTVLSKMEYSSYSQPFVMPDSTEDNIGKQEEEISLTQNAEAENMRSKQQEAKAYSGHTMLLSEYMASHQPAQYALKLVYQGNEQGLEGELPVSKFPCMIGSFGQHCDIRIEHAMVSRIHMCIYCQGADISVEDLNSTNGTYVNGSRLATGEKYSIQNGDELKIATLLYKVEIS